MENELIKALRASSIATEDKNKAVMDALEYAQKCAITFKAIDNPTSEAIIWAGVALSVIVCLVGAGIKIWNWGL
jgi:hypothetical protein